MDRVLLPYYYNPDYWKDFLDTHFDDPKALANEMCRVFDDFENARDVLLVMNLVLSICQYYEYFESKKFVDYM